LWGYSVSGDLPIVLLQIGDAAHIELARQLVQAHAYWRLKGLAVDLVIWNEDRAGYRQILQEQIIGLIAAGVETNAPAVPARSSCGPPSRSRPRTGRCSRRSPGLSSPTAAARSRSRSGGRPVHIAPRKLHADEGSPRAGSPEAVPPPGGELMFFNGLGGFTPDGREYIITTGPGLVTPAPWVNVLANPVRHGHLGERFGVQLGRERPRVPPDALEQRLGHRRRRRGLLPA
jgi:cyclic beta-1,2-glucan synthetase